MPEYPSTTTTTSENVVGMRRKIAEIAGGTEIDGEMTGTEEGERRGGAGRDFHSEYYESVFIRDEREDKYGRERHRDRDDREDRYRDDRYGREDRNRDERQIGTSKKPVSYFDKPAEPLEEKKGGFSAEDKELIKAMMKKEEMEVSNFDILSMCG